MTQTLVRQILTDYPVEESAPMLLGAVLKTPIGSCKIVEVEAYAGTLDAGSHAHRGPTNRNQVMFGPAGYIYTYFTYGSHWMINITAHAEGVAGAILFRAAIPLDHLDELHINRPKAKTAKDLLSGPGKLCAAYVITGDQYGIDALNPESTYQLIPSQTPVPFVRSTRIGLAPGKGEHHLWRFIDAENIEWASNPKSHLRLLDSQAPPPFPK